MLSVLEANQTLLDQQRQQRAKQHARLRRRMAIIEYFSPRAKSRSQLPV